MVINEWMADNAGPGGFADPADGLFQDWFELFNPNTNAVNLSGFYLTDDLSQPTKWRIPTDASSRRAASCWSGPTTSTNQNPAWRHQRATSTPASSSTTTAKPSALFAPDGVTPHSTVTFGPQFQNVSQGLFPDGDTNTLYSMTNWTPRAANQLGTPASPELRGITLLPGDMVSFEFPALPHRTYRVDYKDDLGMPAWTPLSTDRITGGGVIVIQDHIDGRAQRFYRVVLLE